MGYAGQWARPTQHSHRVRGVKFTMLQFNAEGLATLIIYLITFVLRQGDSGAGPGLGGWVGQVQMYLLTLACILKFNLIVNE